MHAILSYVLTLVGIFVAAYVIDFLAGTFSARRDFGNAMRVAAYTPTAAWIVGVFSLLPFLGILRLLGLYSLYLLHTGLVSLMRPPADKALMYTVVTVVCTIVLGVLVAVIPAILLGPLL
jgi:hypothetical protein